MSSSATAASFLYWRAISVPAVRHEGTVHLRGPGRLTVRVGSVTRPIFFGLVQCAWRVQRSQRHECSGYSARKTAAYFSYRQASALRPHYVAAICALRAPCRLEMPVLLSFVLLVCRYARTSYLSHDTRALNSLRLLRAAVRAEHWCSGHASEPS